MTANGGRLTAKNCWLRLPLAVGRQPQFFMENSQFWYLEKFDASAILCPRKQAEPERMAHFPHVIFKKGTVIFVPEDLADRIFLIETGRVKIITTNELGKEITKAILDNGEIFGEMAIINSQLPRLETAIALDETTCCVITMDELRGLMVERNDLTLFFLKIFGRRKLEMERRLTSLVFKDSRSRIVECLVNLTEEKGQRIGYEWVLRNFITHQEIANMTATSRQTVTTTLNDLRAAKLLTFNRSRLLVRDMDNLKTLIIN